MKKALKKPSKNQYKTAENAVKLCVPYLVRYLVVPLLLGIFGIKNYVACSSDARPRLVDTTYFRVIFDCHKKWRKTHMACKRSSK